MAPPKSCWVSIHGDEGECVCVCFLVLNAVGCDLSLLLSVLLIFTISPSYVSLLPLYYLPLSSLSPLHLLS